MTTNALLVAKLRPYTTEASKCIARKGTRDHCDLDNVFAAAEATADVAPPLWTRGIVPDPTRAFLPPSSKPPTWTVLHPVLGAKFTGSAFGDGSGVTPSVERSTRCGYGVVQLSFSRGMPQVVACALGPLPGLIQSTPAAEAVAALTYVCNVVDAPALVFYSDCAWVVNSFLYGRAGSSGAIRAHVDIWRKFWDAQEKRVHAITLMKVKAHVTLAEVAEGYPALWKEENSYADAAAKLGRTLHPIDQEQVREAERALLPTTGVVKFLARINVEAMRAADDTPPFDKNKINERSVAKARDLGPPEHSVVKVGQRFRCSLCLKSSACADEITNALQSCSRPPLVEI